MGLSVAATMTPRKSGIKNRCAQCSAKTVATVARMTCATLHDVVALSAEAEGSADEAILRGGPSMEPAVFAIHFTWEFAIWPYNSAQDEYSTAQGHPLLGEPPGANSVSPISQLY